MEIKENKSKNYIKISTVINHMKRGRPIKSDIRQNIVEILNIIGKGFLFFLNLEIFLSFSWLFKKL